MLMLPPLESWNSFFSLHKLVALVGGSTTMLIELRYNAYSPLAENTTFCKPDVSPPMYQSLSAHIKLPSHSTVTAVNDGDPPLISKEEELQPPFPR
mmetsp:Transcript_32636/g.52242  ORF Transcript_32636/g.52242 Transcript_32636/m.52242 type:complete len:96 (-) Transcript_32636:389-676(-)